MIGRKSCMYCNKSDECITWIIRAHIPNSQIAPYCKDFKGGKAWKIIQWVESILISIWIMTVVKILIGIVGGIKNGLEILWRL